MVWGFLLCHRMSYPTCDILYAAKGGKRWEPCTLKRAIIVMLADMQKALMTAEERKNVIA